MSGPRTANRVVTLAWLMWCYEQGYRTVEDRAILHNWMGASQVNPDDEATRRHMLAMAREVLAALDDEQRG